MTYGKMKTFRKDRLYASDRDRGNTLEATLKKMRINDDQQNYNSQFGNPHYGGSPNRTGFAKGAESKGPGTSKVSPNKTSGPNSTKYNDNSHAAGGQVMTQISAIYAK